MEHELRLERAAHSDTRSKLTRTEQQLASYVFLIFPFLFFYSRFQDTVHTSFTLAPFGRHYLSRIKRQSDCEGELDREEELNAALKEAWDQTFTERRERQRLEERIAAIMTFMDDHQPGASRVLLAALDGDGPAAAPGEASGDSVRQPTLTPRLGTVDL
jgi:hypothetical protein